MKKIKSIILITLMVLSGSLLAESPFMIGCNDSFFVNSTSFKVYDFDVDVVFGEMDPSKENYIDHERNIYAATKIISYLVEREGCNLDLFEINVDKAKCEFLDVNDVGSLICYTPTNIGTFWLTYDYISTYIINFIRLD